MNTVHASLQTQRKTSNRRKVSENHPSSTFGAGEMSKQSLHTNSHHRFATPSPVRGICKDDSSCCWDIIDTRFLNSSQNSASKKTLTNPPFQSSSRRKWKKYAYKASLPLLSSLSTLAAP